MRDARNYLFHDGELRTVLVQREGQLVSEINSFESNYLLNANVDDLCEYLEKKYRLEPPMLRPDETYVGDHGEADVDVSRDQMRWIDDRSKPFYIKGTATTFVVPFDGDPTLFKYQPSTFTTTLPFGIVKGHELHLEYKSTDHNAAAIKSRYEQEIRQIQQHLSWVRENAEQFNAKIPQLVRQKITERREKLLKDQGMAEALGFPIKKRDGAPQTYSVPVTRKTPPVQRPAATTAPYKPEPTLDMKEYEQILSIISNMVTVMERSPKAFVKMDEEDLRQHFLVQLNGQYEGQATGETFNFEGKTDILIRSDGRNIFIAECKFWKGAEGFRATIDQLLGYASWRDTKTAIILFNRNKNLSAVLAQIPTGVASHPNFKKQMDDHRSETRFRFILRQRDDNNREVLLTVLVFDVPI